MTDPEREAQAFPGVRPSLVGAVLGLLTSLALIGLSLVDGPVFEGEALSRAAIAVAAVAPFVLALAVTRAQAHVRAGVWMGTGILAIGFGIAGFTLGILVLIPAGILLVVGGALAMSRARPWPAVSLMAAVLVVGAASFLARSVTNDPQCWKLFRTASGNEWRQVSPDPGPGIGVTLGPNELEATCVADSMTPLESTLVFVAWAGLATGVAVAGRRSAVHGSGPPPAPARTVA